MENCDNDKKNNGIKEQWNKRTMRKRTMNKLTMKKVKKRKTRKRRKRRKGGKSEKVEIAKSGMTEKSGRERKHLTTMRQNVEKRRCGRCCGKRGRRCGNRVSPNIYPPFKGEPDTTGEMERKGIVWKSRVPIWRAAPGCFR